MSIIIIWLNFPSQTYLFYNIIAVINLKYYSFDKGISTMGQALFQVLSTEQ